MDGSFIAGTVVGGVVGFAWAALLFSWRKWRSTIADVPRARAVMAGNLRELVVVGGIAVLAVFVAFNSRH